jgi:hypothetical protein
MVYDALESVEVNFTCYKLTAELVVSVITYSTLVDLS